MTPLVLAGCLVAAGMAWLAHLVLPRQVDPVVTLGRIDAAQRDDVTTMGTHFAGIGVGWRPALYHRLGVRLAAELTGRGITQPTLRQDLGLLGRSYEEHLGTQVATGCFGGVLVIVATVVLSAMGAGLPPVAPAGLLLVVATVFALLPQIEVRRGATARRRTFRHALGSFLDLVAMSMAGGRGLDESLLTCARTGQGWSFTLLAHTLQQARDIGERPWAALRTLGMRIGVDELRDLAGSVELVAESGSKIRDTLSARASTLRRRQISDAEGTAAEREQSLRLAQLVIGLGFVVFIGYPAVANVLAT